MTMPDNFDCVAMKRKLQARLHEKFAGLSYIQMAHRIEEELAVSQDPVAEQFRKLRETQMKKKNAA
jgi:hypothetical protein